MIERERRDGVTVLRMAHGKVNAMDVELLGALVAGFEALAAAGAGPVVLTAAGKAFSAGVDLHRVVAGGRAYLESLLPVLSEAFRRVFEYPGPVVAALNGHAIAGGAVLACCCDHRVMARGAGRVAVPELHVGVPLPSVALEVVRFTVAPERLRAIILDGTEFGPEEALAAGLVDELADPDALLDAALARAARYASVRPETYALAKRQLQAPAAARYRGAEFEPEIDAQWLAPETAERMRARIERAVGRG